MASCTILGSRVALMVLNSVEAYLVDAQQIGLVWSKGVEALQPGLTGEDLGEFDVS